MLKYLIRRTLLMIPTLLGITLVVFVVMATSPGGISAQNLVDGLDMKPAERQALLDYYNQRYGLDDPLPVQYLRWLNNVSPIGFTMNEAQEISGFSLRKGSDLGDSFNYGRKVSEVIAERLPITLLLNVITTPLIFIIAIMIGMHAATQRGKTFDVASNIVMLGLWSLPTMLVGVLLIGFFANVQHWHWFPTSGLSSQGAAQYLFMPHWSHAADLFILFASLLAAGVIAVSLCLYPKKNIRVAVATILGLTLGMAMAYNHAEFFWFNWLFWPVLFALTLAMAAGTNFMLLRVGIIGITTLLLGGWLASLTMQGTYVQGFLFDRAWHLVLPILTLSYAGFASLAKIMRTSILENLHADYARTARAKGVPEPVVLWHHVFKNSLLPLITILAGLLPSLLAGSLIVEQIFSIEGMGKLAIDAVKSRDRELVLSITLISGLLTLVGYLISDILYTYFDPRVRYD